MTKSQKSLRRGVLVAFEGIDGAGKSTQVEMLRRHLEGAGYAVVTLQEPTDGPWGRRIKELSLADRPSLSPEEELELFVKDREEDVRTNIQPALEKKCVVLMDRYYFSSMAYQGARGLDPEQIRNQNEAFAPRPDLVIVLLLSPTAGIRRIESERRRNTYFEREKYLEKVQEIFRQTRGPNVHHLDAAKSPKNTHLRVRELTEKVLRAASEEPTIPPSATQRAHG